MSEKPIAFRNPELTALHEGRLRHFRRLSAGALSSVAVGDRLWIREPYFLPKRWETFKPTEAAALGAEPAFLADVGFRHRIDWLGRIRSARELCRVWHRRHLVIASVRTEELQAISSEDLRDAGYRDAEHFAELWDRDNISKARGSAWHDNPKVLRCTFSLIPQPLPALEPRPARRKPGPKPGQAAAERRDRELSPAPPIGRAELLKAPVAVPAEGSRTWCDQCQRRVTFDEGRACESPFCPIDPPEQHKEAA